METNIFFLSGAFMFLISAILFVGNPDEMISRILLISIISTSSVLSTPIIISILNAQEEDIPAWQNTESDAKPELQCLKFSDGRLAVINTYCTGSYETISWFVSKGYKFGVYAETGCCYEVYMTR